MNLQQRNYQATQKLDELIHEVANDHDIKYITIVGDGGYPEEIEALKNRLVEEYKTTVSEETIEEIKGELKDMAENAREFEIARITAVIENALEAVMGNDDDRYNDWLQNAIDHINLSEDLGQTEDELLATYKEWFQDGLDSHAE